MPFVAELFEYLDKKKIGYCFLTNNSEFPKEHYKKKLIRCGINAKARQIVTSTDLLKAFFKSYSPKSYHTVGGSHLKKAIGTHKNKDGKVDVLFLGMNVNTSIKDLSLANNLLKEDGQIVASNADMYCPKDGGRFDFDLGAALAVFEGAKRDKITIVGKPNAFAYEYIQKKFGFEPKRTLMVGDTFETDILGALNFGINAAYVKTGNALKCDEKRKFYNFENLKELLEFLQK